ncbi:MAG: hypothetical protein V3U56_15145 [Syntrophobacteria bacterium]|jgi:hypothetical protein
MAMQVTPLHYVTVEFRLYDEKQENRAMEASGQHRFLYGVESWIDGVDQRLESLAEGEYLELVLESEAAAFVVSHLLHQDEFPQVDIRLMLELRIVEVVKADPKEVVKTLAASVTCCDHCGSH